MPQYVVERVGDALNSVARPLEGSRVHLFGMAYKPDVGDIREAPAIDVARLLQRRGAAVSFSDPHVSAATDDHGLTLTGMTPDEAFARGFDCAVTTTNHSAFGYARTAGASPLVVDTRNALKGHAGPGIFRL